LGAFGDLIDVAGLAQVGWHVLRSHDDVLCRSLSDAGGHLAAHGTDLSLQFAHAGLAGVLADDAAEGVALQGHLSFQEAVLAYLARHQILTRDGQLFLLGVSGELEDFHAIPQWSRDGVQNVGGRNEHHL